MAALPAGGLVTRISNVPLPQIDAPNFCREDGHVLMDTVPGEDGPSRFASRRVRLGAEVVDVWDRRGRGTHGLVVSLGSPGALCFVISIRVECHG